MTVASHAQPALRVAERRNEVNAIDKNQFQQCINYSARLLANICVGFSLNLYARRTQQSVQPATHNIRHRNTSNYLFFTLELEKKYFSLVIRTILIVARIIQASISIVYQLL